MSTMTTSYHEWSMVVGGDDEDHLTHTACVHDDDRALCGANLAGVPWLTSAAPTADDCIVCETMRAQGDCSCPAAVILAYVTRARFL